MRKKRALFFNALLALAISWGSSYFFNRGNDREAYLLIGAALCLLCLFILTPIALNVLKKERPTQAGLSMAWMLLPLLLVLSHPTFSIAPFSVLWLKPGAALLVQWSINTLINGAVFFLTGFLVVRWRHENVLPWWKIALASLALVLFYLVTLYTSAQLL